MQNISGEHFSYSVGSPFFFCLFLYGPIDSKNITNELLQTVDFIWT